MLNRGLVLKEKVFYSIVYFFLYSIVSYIKKGENDIRWKIFILIEINQTRIIINYIKEINFNLNYYEKNNI